MDKSIADKRKKQMTNKKKTTKRGSLTPFVGVKDRTEAWKNSNMSVGSVVTLNSGGPKMTIQEFRVLDGLVECNCWIGALDFSNGYMQAVTVDPRTLKVVP